LTRKGRLPVDEALDIAIQIAEALAAAHRQGIVHGDLKPENVMLTKTGVKVLDFGIARMNEAAKPAAGTAPVLGTVTGTLPYVAPEQLQGAQVDARTDLFALGAVLYEMLTGARAFEAGARRRSSRPSSSTNRGRPPPSFRRSRRPRTASSPAAWRRIPTHAGRRPLTSVQSCVGCATRMEEPAR